MDREEPGVTEETKEETGRFWEDPRKVMNLLDLLFLWEEPDKDRIKS